MKQNLAADHIAVNKFEMSVPGLGTFKMITIDGIEEELDIVTLPDRTQASGGETKPGSFVCAHPSHETTEEALLEAWFAQSQGNVDPAYKKTGVVSYKRISGITGKSVTLEGLFPMKRTLPELDVDNEGDMAKTEWEFAYDNVLVTDIAS